MAQDEQPGLLSKVVKFVRNPTMNWADLDQPEMDKESNYSKQMLKEMIERKRRNDFVRRREFDQLRKLRQREALVGPDAAGRPSFFQSSLPSKPDDRAVTLKKIDEIEAQMSQQWWKAKGETVPDGESARAAVEPVDSAAPSEPDAAHPYGAIHRGGADGYHANQYANTIDASMPAPMADGRAYAATDISPLLPSHRELDTADAPVTDMLAPYPADLRPDWSAVPAAAVADQEVADFVHDPDLEEPAIRFANGDSAGAETAVLSLLGSGAGPQAHQDIWMTLFDLYRATGQHDRFDTVGIEFATRFGRSAPTWFSIPELAGNTGQQPEPSSLANAFYWTSPSLLAAAQVLALQSTLQTRKPTLINLNWSNLATLHPGALGPLTELLGTWTQQAMELQFVGAGQLDGLIKALTVSGDASVDPAWWRLRMELLRIMQRPDEFDLVALDYCVTYEVSPPSWQKVACSFVAMDPIDPFEGLSLTDDDAIVAEIAPDSVFVDSEVAAGGRQPPVHEAAQAVAAGYLSGLVLGDATEALAPFEAQVLPSGLLVISCEQLIRIDFAAAGSVLNWAAAQQAAGRRVQFRDLHRLAAVFFNVVGVSEHAKVVPRRN